MAHYFDNNPESESKRATVEYRINGVNFSFMTDTDVFSRKSVDFGTDLLLNEVIKDIKTNAQKAESILDLGCGYGVVGIVLKSVFRKASITQVDINERAVRLAKENAQLNRVPIAVSVQSNILAEIDESISFDVVVTNPPVRAGKATVFGFYEQAYKHMNEGGSIYVVLQRKQGAPSTEKELAKLFGNCVTLGIDAGYRVMKATKKEE